METERDRLLNELKNEVRLFLGERMPNKWLRCALGEIYVRKGAIHMIRGEIRTCFDVANVEFQSKYRGHGFMTEFLKWLPEVHNYDATFVESILNERFYEQLLRNGWWRTGADPLCFNLFQYREPEVFDPADYTIKVEHHPEIPEGPYVGTINEIPHVAVYETSEHDARHELMCIITDLKTYADEAGRYFPKPLKGK